MFRVSLPRKAKSELSRSRSALHDEGLDIESERAVKKPKLSVKTSEENPPNPISVVHSDA